MTWSYEVAVIGTGFSGIAVAIELRRRGITDFVMLERADAVGGTWRYNTYPGCAVDVPSLLYSYSYAADHDWSRLYAPAAELRDYTESVVERFGLRPHIRLRSEVSEADFDPGDDRWVLRLRDGSAVRARTVVMGYFSLHVPALPDIPGLDTFRGVQMHSGRWDHEFAASGKRVAVIGSGASAVQIVPALARAGAEVVSVQRSPAWVLPRGDRRIPGPIRAVLRHVPAARIAARAMILLLLEALHLAEFHPRFLSIFERVCRFALAQQVPDPALRARLTPDYRFGCKRPMVSDEYYRSFTRDNVELVTAELAEITPTGLRTADGEQHDVDAIVWATGFRVQDSIDHFPDFRAPGLSTRTKFARDGFTAYRGVAFAGLPNLFAVTGPNTALPHTSQFLGIEPSSGLIARIITRMRDDGVTRYTPSAEAETRWVTEARATLSTRIWSTGGCRSYFIEKDGTNTLVYPGGAITARLERRRLVLRDWERRTADASSTGFRGSVLRAVHAIVR